MRAFLRRELCKEFKNQIASVFPRSGLITDKTAGQNGMVWRSSSSPSLHFFVVLCVAEDLDQFMVEIGWNVAAEFPWTEPFSRLENLAAPSGRGRLSHLWTQTGADPAWAIVPRDSSSRRNERLAAQASGDWETANRLLRESKLSPEEAMSRIPSLVEDAIEKIEQYGIPRFVDVARSKGGTWEPGGGEVRKTNLNRDADALSQGSLPSKTMTL